MFEYYNIACDIWLDLGDECVMLVRSFGRWKVVLFVYVLNISELVFCVFIIRV